jgi:gas vesicle structural protein
MAVERVSGGSSLIDVLDRVLDKGIVIDAWVRISLVGIDLITVEARVVVASIDTYLKYADAVGLTGLVSRPQLTGEELPEVEVETTRRVSRAPVVRRARARRGQTLALKERSDDGEPRAQTETRTFH